MGYSLIRRINFAVRKNSGRPGLYAVSLEGKILFGFAKEGSEDYGKPERELRKQGYKGEYILQSVLNPNKTYIFNAA